MTTQLIEKKLELIVKRGVEEALRSQLPKMRALLMPDISTEEQKNIEQLYHRPSKKTSKNFKLVI